MFVMLLLRKTQQNDEKCLKLYDIKKMIKIKIKTACLASIAIKQPFNFISIPMTNTSLIKKYIMHVHSEPISKLITGVSTTSGVPWCR